jgi:hypothetical protein
MFPSEPVPPTTPEFAQHYPAPGVPGQPQQYAPPIVYGGPPPIRKKTITWVIVAVVGLAIIGIVASVFLGGVLKGHDPDTAKVGDCMAGTNADSLKVTECTDAKVTYRVVGKVDNVTQVGFSMDGSVCKPFKDAENAFWKGAKLGSGYVLCLAHASAAAK